MRRDGATPTDQVEEGTPVAELLPARATLPKVKDAASRCRACALWRNGTQTVFGEGSAGAEIMLVGEQPGDREDLAGRPFVGPAGNLLDKALAEAGIDRRQVYVTNVVKHFKWTRKGKRRIHQKPNAEEIGACRPWLDTEIELVKPRILVCLGATAAQAVISKTFKVTQQRGRFVKTDLEPLLTATVHPSSILRSPDEVSRQHATEELIADLRVVAEKLRELAA